jgi:hypothetical protein
MHPQDDVEHQKKADQIVNAILNLLDKNKDGVVSVEEFEAVGLDGLPNFDDLGAEGHHYDVESGWRYFCKSLCPTHASFLRRILSPP